MEPSQSCRIRELVRKTTEFVQDKAPWSSGKSVLSAKLKPKDTHKVSENSAANVFSPFWLSGARIVLDV
jgi:hypothetical protein